MASRQSSSLCAPPGLLLLLLLLLTGVIFTHRLEVHARSQSLQFCTKYVRDALMKRFETQVKCSDSDKLPSSVRLCTAIRPREWNNKTFQEKHADVLASLQILHNGLKQAVTNQTTPRCLVDLGAIVHNYLILVKNNAQSGLVTASPSAVQHCSNETTLTKVLNGSKQLLKGKLEVFAKECPQNNH